jgi:hypothetical protein
MKPFNSLILFIMITLAMSACSGNTSRKKDVAAAADTTSVPDTGYTGIKKFYSNDRLIKEITFKNGVREGAMRSFYQGGQVYQWLWYENGHREDSVVWYYLEGQVFRTTPFKHDTVDGIQKQYYRNGKIRARIKFVRGLRSTSFEEYDDKGQLIKGYPDIVYSIKDNYKINGQVGISLGLSNNSSKVTFYKGELTNGLFDTANCVKIKTINGKATINLKKSDTPGSGYQGVVAEIITSFGNRYITGKRIELPYKDLK